VASLAPPALRKNGALPVLPFPLPCPRTGPLLGGAVGCSSAHTENVRTTNKISIKLSFVSSPRVSFWERMNIRKPKVSFLGGQLIFQLLKSWLSVPQNDRVFIYPVIPNQYENDCPK
jgi:hypothetical protein